MIDGGSIFSCELETRGHKTPLLESAQSCLTECLLFYCALAEHIALPEEVLPCGDVSLYFSLSLSCDLDQQLRTAAQGL